MSERLGLEGKTWRQELQERRQQTAEPTARENEAEIEAAAARTEAARATASPEAAWKAAVAANPGVRSKAERILAEIEKRKAALAKKLAEIERDKPAAPRGLSALFSGAKARHEERHSEWMGQRDMLLKALRRADERAKTVREFTVGGIAGYPGRGEKLTERKAAARHPALAQAMQAEQDQRRKNARRLAAARSKNSVTANGTGGDARKSGQRAPPKCGRETGRER